jgi:hypothetical protein
MTKQVQRRRGTATQHTSFTGAEGETSVNTTNKSVHVHDGSTAGGIEAARADLVNVSDASLNAALTGNTVAALTITTADINGGTIDGATIDGRDVGADGTKLDSLETTVLTAGGTGYSTSYVSTVAVGGTTFAQPAVSGTIHSDEGEYVIDYAGATGITVASGVASVYVYIDNASNLQQQTTVPTRQDWSRKMFTMRIAMDTDAGTILGFEYLANPLGHYPNSIRDFYSFMLAQGVPFKKDQVVTGRAGDLGFDVSAGEVMELGGTGDIHNANIISLGAVSNAGFFLTTRTAFDAGGNTNLPKFWDNGGTLTALGSTTLVGHRLYRFSNGNLCLQYGQGNYANMTLAKAGVLQESYVLNPALKNATFFGWWFIQSTATVTAGTPTLTAFVEYTLGTQGGVSSALSGAALVGNNGSDFLDAGAVRTNIGLGTGDSPTFAGGTLTGDVSFGDNDKAIFGAGSDLQIFHNGVDSYIQEAGTGRLYIRGSDSVRIQAVIGSENMAIFNENGSVQLYHDNSEKLETTATGIDVTGTITSDGLNVDGGATSPTISITGARSGTLATISNTSASTSNGLIVSTASTNANSNPLWVQSNGADRLKIAGSGDISFYEDTGTTPKFFWDASAESLGIGNSSPATALDVTGTITSDGLNVATTGEVIGTIGSTSTSGARQATLRLNVASTGGDDPAGRVQFTHGAGYSVAGSIEMTHTNPNMKFLTGTTERMRIDSNGNVGIGTSSLQANLHVNSGASNLAGLFESDDAGTTITLIDNGTTGGSAAEHGLNAVGDQLELRAVDNLSFETAGSEAIRIDSSQNVLVGTTSLAVFSDTNDGVMIEPAGAVVASRNSNTVGFFRRRGTNGGVFTFLKDTTAVGSISVTGSATAYNTSSDYRLKEDWVPMSGASERVQALKPVNFAWKLDASRVDGFLAHELAEVIPEAVSGSKDAMQDEEHEVTPAVLDEDGNETSPAVMGTRSIPDMQGIDQSKIVPLLTAALQEALTKIADLETRLTALEA